MWKDILKYFWSVRIRHVKSKFSVKWALQKQIFTHFYLKKGDTFGDGCKNISKKFIQLAKLKKKK